VVAVDDPPVGQHHPGSDQAVAGQPVRPAEQTDAAAEGEADDAQRCTAPGGQRSAVGVQRVVHVPETAARSEGGPAAGVTVIRAVRSG
jgi:hypothetical protein